MIDDGVIKFNFEQVSKEHQITDIASINQVRTQLFHLHLIGEYTKEKIGFGNISIAFRDDSIKFLISASQTGKYEILTKDQYSFIENFSFDKNHISYSGSQKPSSESLTHASIYTISDQINAVIHIHDKVIWRGMIENDYPSTSEETEYGTLDMAKEVRDISQKSIDFTFAMKGHEDGVVAYSSNLNKAFNQIVDLYNRFHWHS